MWNLVQMFATTNLPVRKKGEGEELQVLPSAQANLAIFYDSTRPTI